MRCCASEAAITGTMRKQKEPEKYLNIPANAEGIRTCAVLNMQLS